MKINNVKAKSDLYTELAKLKKENLNLRKDNKTYEICFNRIRKFICQEAVAVGKEPLQITRSDIENSIDFEDRNAVSKTLVLSEARNILSHLVKSGEDDKENSQISISDSPATALKCHKAPPPKEPMDKVFDIIYTVQ